jgi:hypothetical protein
LIMLANRVREFSITIGTGDVALGGALAGHIRFGDAFAVGDSVIYVIEDGDNYEIGTGTYQAGDTLARTSVSETLEAGVLVKSGALAIALTGQARIYCAATAEFLLDPVEAADVIKEVSPGAGVTVDGVLLKDSSITASSASFSGDVNIADAKKITLSGTSGDYGALSYADADPDLMALNYYQNSSRAAAIEFSSTSEAAGDGLLRFMIGSTAAQSFDNAGNATFAADIYGKTLARGLGTASLGIAGGSGGATGGNALFYGENHATQAGDILFRSGSLTKLHFDASADTWSFQGLPVAHGNLIMSGATAAVVKSNGLGSLTLSGGAPLT